MTEQQIPKLAGAIVEHQGEFADLPTDDGQWAIQHTKEAIGLFKAAVVNRHREKVATQPLLKYLDTTTILQPSTAPFVVADNFKKDNADGVVISTIWDGFQSLCGSVVEEPIKETIELRSHKLLRSEKDKPIIVELGGEAAAETFFAAIWELMKLQKNGGKGKLLTNGYANIFYVRVKGVLLVVNVHWLGNGWYVNAYSVEFLLTWSAGHRVFSSNSGNLAA